MDYTGNVFDDYEVLEYIEYKNNNSYYKVRCLKCGHEKQIAIKNMMHQDNHCTGLNCGFDHYKHCIGKEYGDYVCESIENAKGFRAILRCKYCNHLTNVSASVLDTVSFEHSPSKCSDDYYKSEVGKVYGDYKIISTGNYIGNEKAMNCECVKCHTESIKTLRSLRKHNFKHGLECLKNIPDSEIKSMIVTRFADMKQRCNNPNNSGYSHYGNRNIKLEYEFPVDLYYDFVNDFIKLQKAGKNIHDYSFDRINVNDNYRKDNLRLTTQNVQSTNTTRRRIFIIQKDDMKILTDNSMKISNFLGINGRSLGNVLRGNSKTAGGWSLVRIVEPDEKLSNVYLNEDIDMIMFTTIEPKEYYFDIINGQ